MDHDYPYLEKEKEEQANFANKVVVDLKSGFDMPVNSESAYSIQPSVYCEIGYKKLGEYFTYQTDPAMLVRTRTCVQTRNPIWNERYELRLLDEDMGLTDMPATIF